MTSVDVLLLLAELLCQLPHSLGLLRLPINVSNTLMSPRAPSIFLSANLIFIPGHYSKSLAGAEIRTHTLGHIGPVPSPPDYPCAAKICKIILKNKNEKEVWWERYGGHSSCQSN